MTMAMDRKTARLESQLCKAVKDGDPRAVQLLLSQGASPDLVGSKGVAAMHLAVGKETEKNTRCLKMLLQHGANPNIRSSDGLTPLHVAALWGCFQNLKLLLINGGNPNIKDNEGNTPKQLAEQQENQKCAHLLQEYQISSVETEEDDLPQFQYSVYSEHTDTSSYPESDYSFSSRSSMISEFGEAPMSSTRRSSFFNLSNINGRPSCREMPYDRISGPSILSSTRMSAVEPAVAMSILKEDDSCTDDGMVISGANKHSAANDGRASLSRRDTLPAFFSSRQTIRKSVSFRDVDEYFPVFSPESPKKDLAAVDDSRPGSRLAFDMTEYPDFLHSERMATVLHKQGIDVTSPDHVYVFCRVSSSSTEEDLDKTVMSRCAFDEQETENVKEDQGNIPEHQAHFTAGSSGSGTGSSHYSSCESDHYTSALEASVHPRHHLLPAVEEVSAGAGTDRVTQISTDSETEFTRLDGNFPRVREETKVDTECDTKESLPNMLEKMNLSEAKHTSNNVLEACSGPVVDISSNRGVDKPVADTRSEAIEALEEKGDLPFTPSPFVTGRTRSRLSRCSLRTSRTPESIFSTSTLFEETLPTPVRTRRQTPRSQSYKDFHGLSPALSHLPSHSAGSSTGGDSLPMDCEDTESSTLGAFSSVNDSQADTLILSKKVTDSAGESQTLCDTVVLEKNQDTSVDAYERNLAEIILAMQQQDLVEGREFLTDDLTSADEITTKENGDDAPGENQEDGLENRDGWITEDLTSQIDSASSSSSSSYFSPRKSREDSDPSCTPGTGCTPRYSMSRLSSCRRPQSLANLSYTPGGRPHILDLDEPVEYLYTDTEQGHKLIETHVPPNADTSLSSSMSTTSNEETILYDWRPLQTDMMSKKGKENEKPQAVVVGQREESVECEENVLPETKGLTDKELRLRLMELGESPGPISSRTRPTYIRRLGRLLQETKLQSQHQQKHLHQPQADLGYSPELCRVLQTFKLPDCQADEQALCQQFDQPDQNRKWREGIIKSSFNYLLLDPRVTKNLPFRSQTMTPQECFETFVRAIFYVGKGKRSRPYSHLYEALEYYKGDKTSKKLCLKVQHILQVWKAEQGVISLHCFQNVIPVEAYTREACMVEAIGLKMLTNQKRGDFYGIVSNWQVKRKRELGIHLLYRAMQIFLAEGERQLRPADIRQ
ncbi:ankyrin repeat and LEM domain-containing protein 1 [Mugil cephalus]|uniref:ankyrin repeat and LEM domain-containing protein 1 n=1 Tax=Mugil cephalus TaxID=48193 RepID=UPI001FB7D7C5|nr:ankyrin repeat and LEM domain-containing protein 1 [Mugil cephalus]